MPIKEAAMEAHWQDRNLLWVPVESREDRNYNLFSVYLNKNKSPRTGRIHEFQVLKSPDWVAIIPVTPNNELVMVSQYRHGIEQLSLEPPGGLVKDGQTPEQSAIEELEEETGYRAPAYHLLGWMHPMPAILTNRFYVYLAENATPTGKPNPEETEEIETILVPVSEITDYIRTGKITCSVMIAALHLYLNRE
jgi:ADP-ribose pyrophosphatase